MRARQGAETALPLRGYFLPVGGALLCLLVRQARCCRRRRRRAEFRESRRAFSPGPGM